MTEELNVLITVVGDRDPLPFSLFDPSESQFSKNLEKYMGPVLETLEIFESGPADKQCSIARAWLIFTEDRQDKKIQARVKWLIDYFGRKGIVAKAIDLKINDPSDYRLLMPSMNAAAISIRKNSKDIDAKFFVLTNPGTPQMSTTWVVLGNEGRLAGTFLQKKPGDREMDASKKEVLKRLNSGVLEDIPLDPFFEYEKVKQIATLIEKHAAFASCSELLSDLASSTLFKQREQQFQSAYLVCKLFSEWDANHYTKSLQLVQDSKQLIRGFFDRIDTDLVDQVLICLRLLAEKDLTEEVLRVRVENLLAIADRRHMVGEYSACVASAFLAYETLLVGTLQLPPYNYNVNEADRGDTVVKEDRLLGQDGKPIHAAMKKIKYRIGNIPPRDRSELYKQAYDLRKTRNKIIHEGLQVSAAKSIQLLRNAENLTQVFFSTSEHSVFPIPIPYSSALVAKISETLQEVARLS